ncbi:uncharacterized protein KQ657_002602 [Scheffersomyces spartinae]|uniref:EamA domain-containing protein n=1 Tax=Scheffersomyces spartinae TaxID=45513 RepID=A0A9P8AGQ2_9ASCO|nr:uncharacterized protein KQ657_002602 [Scheffersomyces spartinae]KAG7191995.1 hypothetical protein KQ657_002602 [Scheffersomyces spartinae]
MGEDRLHQLKSCGGSGEHHVVRSPMLEAAQESAIRSNEVTAQITHHPVGVLEIINDQETKNFRLGVLLIILALATWIGGLELINVVMKGGSFDKPFLISVVTGTCFSLNFLPDVFYYLKRRLWRHPNNKTAVIGGENQLLLFKDSTEDPWEAVVEDNFKHNQPIELTRFEVLTLALQIALIYYSYNISVMCSLRFTSASNQTVIGSTTSIFTLFIGVGMATDKFSFKKVVCVCVSSVGVFLVNISQSKVGGNNNSGDNGGNIFQPKNPSLGNFFALIGAFTYAIYLLIMKIKCGTGNKTTNERRLFGWVGVFSFLVGLPMLYIVDKIGLEPFELPPDAATGWLIITNGVFSVISDFATICAMLLTSPLVTSLSLTSCIPITIFIDYLIMSITGDGKTNLNLVYLLGISSILISVILINVNVTSEHELIEDAIEEALEEAIKDDEILSPILSPLLGTSASASSSALTLKSPTEFLKKKFDANRGLQFSPRFNSITRPQSPSPVPFLLSSEEDGTNPNHSKNLYTVENEEVENPDGNRTPDGHRPAYLVYSGGNHKYHVRQVQSPQIGPSSGR